MTEDNCDTEVDPRKKCLLDIEKWANKDAMEGQHVIALVNANQSLDNKTKDYNPCDTIEKCLLESVMETKHAGASLQSLDHGTKTIDHVLTQGIDAVDIHRVGQLPFGLGFHTNHRGLFVNMDGDQLLGLRMQEPEQHDGRRLIQECQALPAICGGIVQTLGST